MECRKCNMQYVGKSETKFNIRLNNHRKDSYNPKNDTIPACIHYSKNNHDFNRDAMFTILEKIKDETLPPERKRKILMKRENFWITKLKTLQPNGLNHELNEIQL